MAAERDKGDPRPRITSDKQIDAAQPEAGQYTLYDDRVKGLSLRISPGGKKAWSLFYRNAQGTARRLPLGVYKAVTLKKARQAAEEAIGDIARGGDPVRDRQKTKAAGKAGNVSSVASLVEAYLDAAAKGRHRPSGRPNRPSTITQDRYYFTRLIKPDAIAKHAAKDVTRAEARAFLEKTGDAHGPTAARMCGTLLRAAFNYGIRREHVAVNPFALIEIPRAGKRDRVLTDTELAKVWNAARNPEPLEVGVSPLMGLAILFAMTTLQRGGEVCGLKEPELDDKGRTWTIPGERTKNHLIHVVPLSRRARAIIKLARRLRAKLHNSLSADDIKAGYLFPSSKGGSITRHALSRAMKRLTTKIGVVNATLHDTRRTGATNITGERIGLPRFIVSRVLNQISDTGGAAAVTGVYDRNEYLVEKRKALDAWAALLRRVVKS